MENITNIEAIGYIKDWCDKAELLKQAELISNYNYSLNYDTVGYETSFLNIEFTLVIRGAEDIKFETKWYDKEEAEVVRARLEGFESKLNGLLAVSEEYYRKEYERLKTLTSKYERIIDIHFNELP